MMRVMAASWALLSLISSSYRENACKREGCTVTILLVLSDKYKYHCSKCLVCADTCCFENFHIVLFMNPPSLTYPETILLILLWGHPFKLSASILPLHIFAVISLSPILQVSKPSLSNALLYFTTTTTLQLTPSLCYLTYQTFPLHFYYIHHLCVSTENSNFLSLQCYSRKQQHR